MSSIPEWLVPPGQSYLTADERAQLDALFAHLAPADLKRSMPGAVDAGGFVDNLLACPPAVYWEIAEWRRLYRDGLAALERHSQQIHGRPLVQLDDCRVNELLRLLEAGRLDGLPPDIGQTALFKTLRRHCIQACFADPRWHGDRDQLLWGASGYVRSPANLLGRPAG